MTHFFDASAPPPEQPDVREELRQARRIGAERRLEAALDRVNDLVARVQEQDEEELEPEIKALLSEVAGAPDAPLELQSLSRRVSEGRLTWEEFWRRPQDHAGGARLMGLVMHLQMERMRSLLAEAPDADQLRDTAAAAARSDRPDTPPGTTPGAPPGTPSGPPSGPPSSGR